MLKNPVARKIALVVLRFAIVVAAVVLLIRAFTTPLDEAGTREVMLVKVNGSTFCQSCMGLYR